MILKVMGSSQIPTNVPYSSTGGSVYECGKTNQQVRGLEMRDTTFTCVVKKALYTTIRTNRAWSISGSSTSLFLKREQETCRLWDTGFNTTERDSSLSTAVITWSSGTLYYREYGTGWTYQTTPAPGTTEWFGPVTKTGDDVLSVT